MKKNKMMRLASVMLVLVLMTSSVVGGTFAKYTTSDNASDQARVAKFGVVVDVTADAFSEIYAATVTENDASGTAIANTVVAASDDNDNLLAPGTNGTLGTSSITGIPEVAVKVTKLANLELTGWEVDNSYYCPLEIKVDNWVFNGMEYSSADDFEAAVEGALSKTTNYDPNTNLSSMGAGDHTISWKWLIENGVGQDNAKDTKLGDAAANQDIKIEFSYSITVEQID